MCQTWHSGTQLYSQLPEDEVGAADETHNKHGKVKQDLENLNSSLNTKEHLIQAYPNRFKCISHFPGAYHMLWSKPVVYAPQKCPIQPLVWEKLDEFLEQGIIIPVEPTDWVSSLTYSWKANGKLRVFLDPWDVNKDIKRIITRPPLLR